jgi:hypothetical protein
MLVHLFVGLQEYFAGHRLETYDVPVGGLANLPLDPKFAGSNPAEEDELLMAIKICSTTSLEGK